ncbi:hypothetical protein ABT072_34710 [Streptomyces sp. NPDC002589]|uniref:hypothetical protein n=1 Tax=Streptomyces sp. NPDC002589 TaxID=3154420 RepID=UPI0033345296
MSGRTDSDAGPAIAENAEQQTGDRPIGQDAGRPVGEDPDEQNGEDAQEQVGEQSVGEARRARWTAAATGVLLALAGLAAALVRFTGAAPVRVPAAFALGAAVCAFAAVLGAKGRTRRALWLLIAGTMVMAFGDQSD